MGMFAFGQIPALQVIPVLYELHLTTFGLSLIYGPISTWISLGSSLQRIESTTLGSKRLPDFVTRNLVARFYIFCYNFLIFT